MCPSISENQKKVNPPNSEKQKYQDRTEDFAPGPEENRAAA